MPVERRVANVKVTNFPTAALFERLKIRREEKLGRLCEQLNSPVKKEAIGAVSKIVDNKIPEGFVILSESLKTRKNPNVVAETLRGMKKLWRITLRGYLCDTVWPVAILANAKNQNVQREARLLMLELMGLEGVKGQDSQWVSGTQREDGDRLRTLIGSSDKKKRIGAIIKIGEGEVSGGFSILAGGLEKENDPKLAALTLEVMKHVWRNTPTGELCDAVWQVAARVKDNDQNVRHQARALLLEMMDLHGVARLSVS